MSWRAALAGFLTLVLGGSSGLAQTPDRVFRVGLLCGGADNRSLCGPGMVKHFVDRGYQPGVNLLFEKRAAQGQLKKLPEYVTELVASHVDLTWALWRPSPPKRTRRMFRSSLSGQAIQWRPVSSKALRGLAGT